MEQSNTKHQTMQMLAYRFLGMVTLSAKHITLITYITLQFSIKNH